MSKYLTRDKVSSLLFVDNNENSSSSDRYLDDDDCSDYVLSDDDNEEDIILFDPDYDCEDNNNDDDNAAARDANDKNITNTTTALLKLKSGIESWAVEPLLHLTFKSSQRNKIREKSGPTRYFLRASGSLGDCFCSFFRNNLLEEICKSTNKEGRGIFSDNCKDTTVV